MYISYLMTLSEISFTPGHVTSYKQFNQDAEMTSLPTLLLRSGTSTYSLYSPSESFELNKGSIFLIRGEETQSAKKYTLKIYVRSGVVEADRAQRSSLVSEQKIIEAASHPYIAKCEGIGRGVLELLETIYFVDYLLFEPVEPLSEAFSNSAANRGSALTETKVKAWFKQISTAISYLHSKGITYGTELSLNDVFLAPDSSQIRLLDFSKAKFVARGESNCCDKSGTKMNDFADDVYRLGLLLFCMRTMRFPFGEDSKDGKNIWKGLFYSPWRLYYWEGVARQIKGISVEFINLINGMLEAEPSKRFTVERVLKHQYLTVSK